MRSWMGRHPFLTGSCFALFVVIVGIFIHCVLKDAGMTFYCLFVLVSVFVGLMAANTEGEKSWDSHLQIWHDVTPAGDVWLKDAGFGYVLAMFLALISVGTLTDFFPR